MAIIDAFNENSKTLRTLSAHEIKDLWDFYMRISRDTLTLADFDRTIKEAYNDITTIFSNYDSDSSHLVH